MANEMSNFTSPLLISNNTNSVVDRTISIDIEPIQQQELMHVDNDIKYSCDENGINACNVWNGLQTILNSYDNSYDNGHNQTVFYDQHYDEMVNILDTFHHFISYHRSDSEFVNIFNSLEKQCALSDCVSIQRMYGNNTETSKCNQLMQDIIDQIHCYFHHQYDIGCRYTNIGQQPLIEMQEHDSLSDVSLPSTTTQCIKSLNNKRIKFNKIVNNNRYNNVNNKFSSNLSQTTVQITANQNSNTKSYSFSFPFYYLEKFKNCKLPCYDIDDIKHNELYVSARYQSLKHELLQNKKAFINALGYNEALKKAEVLLQTRNARKKYANTHKYYQSYQQNPNHPIHCEYKDGSPITVKHLLVLIIYCSYDTFQNKFTETYRALKASDTLETIKWRHAWHHHFAKYIKEAVEVFGTSYIDGVIKIIYHGINAEMVFDGMQANIYGVLSTTASWAVAVQFSNNTGLIVDLIPEWPLRYFQCEWLSPFSYEAELLFVGGLAKMNFVNVTNARYGWNFGKYITALRLIDNMANGSLFMVDPSNIHSMKKLNCFDVKQLKLPMLTASNKKLCLDLLHHELNRNGYETNKYKKCQYLHKYVDQLLHQMCINKRRLRIDCNTMCINTLKECKPYMTIGSGYIGYSFMTVITEIFGGKVNLDLINALFPNLVMLEIMNLSPKYFGKKTNSDLILGYSILTDILLRLKNKDSTIRHVGIGVEMNQNINKQCVMLRSHFNRIGFDISVKEENKVIIYSYVGFESACAHVGTFAGVSLCVLCVLVIIVTVCWSSLS